MNTIKNRIVNFVKSDYFNALILKSVGALTTLVYTILLSRYMGTTIKGQVDVVLNYAGLFSIIFGFGIHESYPELKKKDESVDEKYFRCANAIFLLYILVSAVLFIMVQSLSVFAISIITALQVYGGYTSIVFTASLPKKYFLYSILLDISMAIITGVLYIWFNSSFIISIWLMIAKELLHLLFLFVGMGYVPAKYGLSFSGIFGLLKMSFVSMIALLLMTLNYKIDVLMLEGHVSYGEIGIYTLGVSLASKLWLVPDAIKQMLTSKLIKGYGVDEVHKALKTCVLWCGVLSILIICFGRPAIEILFGRDYSGAYIIMLYMLIGIYGMIFYKIIYAYNVVLGKRRVNMLIMLITAVANIILNYYLIPRYGINGAALASVVSYLCCGMLFFVFFRIETRNLLSRKSKESTKRI